MYLFFVLLLTDKCHLCACFHALVQDTSSAFLALGGRTRTLALGRQALHLLVAASASTVLVS